MVDRRGVLKTLALGSPLVVAESCIDTKSGFNDGYRKAHEDLAEGITPYRVNPFFTYTVKDLRKEQATITAFLEKSKSTPAPSSDGSIDNLFQHSVTIHQVFYHSLQPVAFKISKFNNPSSC